MEEVIETSNLVMVGQGTYTSAHVTGLQNFEYRHAPFWHILVTFLSPSKYL